MHAYLLAVHRRLEHEDLEHLKGKVLVFLPAEFIKRYNAKNELYAGGYIVIIIISQYSD
jgi:hypothetical protein